MKNKNVKNQGQANFNDYSSVNYGGWSKPNIKQYSGSGTLCDAGIDSDYYP